MATSASNENEFCLRIATPQGNHVMSALGQKGKSTTFPRNVRLTCCGGTRLRLGESLLRANFGHGTLPHGTTHETLVRLGSNQLEFSSS